MAHPVYCILTYFTCKDQSTNECSVSPVWQLTHLHDEVKLSTIITEKLSKRIEYGRNVEWKCIEWMGISANVYKYRKTFHKWRPCIHLFFVIFNSLNATLIYWVIWCVHFISFSFSVVCTPSPDHSFNTFLSSNGTLSLVLIMSTSPDSNT